MFGYIVANKAELKIREFDVYQSYYCGLCKQLKARGGNLSRMALSYDMTFVYMLLSGLYEPDTECGPCKCALHPFEKRMLRRNVCGEYVAHMSLLMTYYKAKDDWRDERKLRGRLMMWALSGKCKKVSHKYPQKADQIRQLLCELTEGEKQGCIQRFKAARQMLQYRM